jgi:hypothetical protein
MRPSPKTSPILSGSQTGEFIGFLNRRSHQKAIPKRMLLRNDDVTVRISS